MPTDGALLHAAWAEKGIDCFPCSISPQAFAHAKRDNGLGNIALQVYTPCF